MADTNIPGLDEILAEAEAANAQAAEDLPPPPTTEGISSAGTKQTEQKCPNKENIIIIGSEESYKKSAFWNHMMFMSCGFMVAFGNKWRYAKKNTIIYIDKGYSFSEKLCLDYLRDSRDTNIVAATTKSKIINYLKKRTQPDGEEYKIQDLFIFSHGLPEYISLNYLGPGSDMNLNIEDFKNLPSDIFCSDGLFYSYACRTGIKMAQPLADHFKITVKAFKRRTNYGNCIRKKSSESVIKEGLFGEKDLGDKESYRLEQLLYDAGEPKEQIVDLPPEHEALPNLKKTKRKPKHHSLWRKKGAYMYPASDKTPAEQPAGMLSFKP